MLLLGILSRPLGALIFGRLGDRIGGRRTFSITLMGMAAATGTMGFLPVSQGTYAVPFVWGALRLLQGFFAAGEASSGAIYLLERVKKENRCLWGSFFDAFGILGILAASGAVALSFICDFSWSWLFWAGSLTGLIGAIIRLSSGEEILIKKKEGGTLLILWTHKKTLIEIASVAGFSYANYYLLTTFMNGFLPLVSQITKTEAISMNTFLLFGDFLLLPLFGIIGSKIGKEKLMLGALLLAAAGALPLFGLAAGATYSSALLIRISLTCIGVALAAPYHAWVLEKVPQDHRYLIGAFGSAIGSRLIGAPAPVISLWLYQKTGLSEMAALPVIVSALFALIAIGRPIKHNKILKLKYTKTN